MFRDNLIHSRSYVYLKSCALPLLCSLSALADLKINEVYYDVNGSLRTNQFIELYNSGSTTSYLDSLIITDEAMEILCQYTWPGNVRELENTVERIVLMGSEHGISADEMLLLLPAFNQKLMCQRRIMSEEE